MICFIYHVLASLKTVEVYKKNYVPQKSLSISLPFDPVLLTSPARPRVSAARADSRVVRVGHHVLRVRLCQVEDVCEDLLVVGVTQLAQTVLVAEVLEVVVVRRHLPGVEKLHHPYKRQCVLNGDQRLRSR